MHRFSEIGNFRELSELYAFLLICSPVDVGYLSI